MKQMKFFLVALMAVVMGMSVTSCMKGESESSYDLGLNATVIDDVMQVCLLGDDGVVYYPNNASVLKGTSGYPERVFVFLKYAEGVTSASTKKEVSIVQGGGLYTRSICLKPDTIKNDLPLVALTEVGVLDATTVNYTSVSAYCNVIFSLYLSNSAAIIDLVPISAAGNELTVKLQQTIGDDKASNASSGYASFKIPSVSQINSVLASIAAEKGEEATSLIPSGGKIKIKIVATGKNGALTPLNTKEVKVN